MTNLARYKQIPIHSNDLNSLIDKIAKTSIGWDDDHWNRLFNTNSATSNYPPYNLIQLSNVSSRLEVALAGFKKDDLKVYTEHGRLVIEGSNVKDNSSDVMYVHQGLAQRSFKKEWTLSDDVEVKDVSFEDGLLTVELHKIVPERHMRKDWEI